MRRAPHIPHPPAPRHRSWRSAPLIAALVLGGAAFGAIGSSALWQDAAVIGVRPLATGTVDIAMTPAVATMALSAMAPGDEITAPVDVTNRGHIERRYALESTTSETALASALVFTVKTGVVDCSSAGWRETGLTLYAGPLGSEATAPIFGSAAPGQQAGDRTLAPGQDEELCLNVSLPADGPPVGDAGDAGDAGDNSTTATFELRAEPTAEQT